MNNCCSCWHIAREELISSSLFDLNEASSSTVSGDGDNEEQHSNRLDVQQTFSPGPKHFVYILGKLALCAWVTSITVQSIEKTDHPEFWLAYLTHWGWTATNAYFVCSVACATHLALFPLSDEDRDKPGRLCILTWALLSIAFPSEVVITILFWTLEFSGTFRYVSIMVHGGGILLLLLDAFLLSRIPLRMKQFFLFEAFASIYLLWSFIHAYSGIGNPDRNDGQDDDDAIYASLKWRRDLPSAVVLAAGTIVVVNPIIFLFCRVVSRLLPRRLYEEGSGDNKVNDKYTNIELMT